jgi:hypothetical protein
VLQWCVDPFDIVVLWVRRGAESPLYVLLPVVVFLLVAEKADYPSSPGSWFTQFINLVSESNLGIGSGLGSCTSVVQPGKPFDLDGRRVILVDTPGFDDTTRSDVDILNTIALFFATL